MASEDERIVSRLTEAREKIQAAVQADQALAYKDALVRYTEAVEILLGELPKVPPQSQSLLHDKCKKYQFRVNILLKALPNIAASLPALKPYEVSGQIPASTYGTTGVTDAGNGANLAQGGIGAAHSSNAASQGSSSAITATSGAGTSLTLPASLKQAFGSRTSEVKWSPVNFGSVPSLGQPPTGPHSSFFYFRQLFESMQKGAYVATNVYVPHGVWMQLEVRVPALDAKLQSFCALIEMFDRLFAVNLAQDMQAAIRELSDLSSLMDESRAMLKKELPFVTLSASPQPKGLLGTLGSRARQLATGGKPEAMYSELVAETISRCLHFEQTLTHFEVKGSGMDSITRIVDYLQAVLLPLLMRDLTIYIDSYVMKVSQLFA